MDDLDNLKRELDSKFSELDQRFNYMKTGLMWFWNKFIYPPLNFIIITPLVKLLEWLTGEEEKERGDDWF